MMKPVQTTKAQHQNKTTSTTTTQQERATTTQQLWLQEAFCGSTTVTDEKKQTQKRLRPDFHNKRKGHTHPVF